MGVGGPWAARFDGDLAGRRGRHRRTGWGRRHRWHRRTGWDRRHSWDRRRRSQLRFGHRRRPRLGLLLAAAAVAALAGGGAALSRVATGARHGAAGGGANGAAAALAAAVVTTPSAGAAGVPLDAPVVVSTRAGRLLSVRVTGGPAVTLAGSLDPAGARWTSGQLLAASTTYRITATVAGPGGVTATARSSFTTLAPTAWVGTTVWPDNGLTVGVGQPIVLTLSHPVSDPVARQALIARLHLSMSAPVPVGALWFSDTELHLRPQGAWPTGEQIALSGALDGWDAGGGAWGRGSAAVRFAVGDARVSVADLATHQMTVTDNGRTVATYPISAGSDQYPTMNGIHIVMDRQQQVRMVSSTVGIPVDSPSGYDETVYWDVHISDSGEYVHAAPWSVGAQGSRNVSHGCINLSPANAQAFFAFSRVGDIVNVVDGPRAPVPGDHGVMDWDTAWSAFTPVPVSAL